MDLNRLDFPALAQLATAIEALRAAGAVLTSAGYSPTFDLSPGFQMRIELGVEMSGMPVQVSSASAPLVVVEGVQQVSANILPETPSIADTAARWSDEEDGRLVAIVAGEMFTGSSKTAAIERAAAELGRPVPGTGWRLRKLGPTVIEEETRRLMTAAAKERRAGGGGDCSSAENAENAPVQEVASAVEAVTPEPAATSEAPVPDPFAQLKAALSSFADPHPIVVPLSRVPDGDWTPDDNRDLLQWAIAGMSIDDIAAELDRKPEAVRTRFDALTNNRKFPRQAVLDVIVGAMGAMAAE